MFSVSYRVLLLLPLAGVLGGCPSGGGGAVETDDDDLRLTIAPPVTVLRSGESDVVEVRSSASPDVPISLRILDGQVTSLGALRPCTPSDPRCRALTVSAGTALPGRELASLLSDNSSTQDDAARVSVFPRQTELLPPAVDIAAGGANAGFAFSLAALSDGSVYAWGDNLNGQLGNPEYASYPQVGMPIRVAGLSGIVSVAAGRSTGYALHDDGTVSSWGGNQFGQLGDGSQAESSSIPRAVPGLANVTEIAAGDHHAVVLLSDGTVWAWGDNEFGQLGDGSANNTRSGPQQVLGLTNIVSVSAGGEHTLALSSDGSVWSWGANDKGQLGTGSTTQSIVPTRVSGFDDAIAIAAGLSHSLAIRSGDRSVWAWGDNFYSALGGLTDNDCRCATIPQAVTSVVEGSGGSTTVSDSLDRIFSISTSFRFSLAIGNDGSVWEWGSRSGIDAAFFRATLLPDLPSVRLAAAGGSHAVVLTEESGCDTAAGFGGRLLSWGGNVHGQRGDGTGKPNLVSGGGDPSPQASLAPTPVLSIGDDATCALSGGNRIVIFKGGIGEGTISSSAGGLKCEGPICWQTVPVGTQVTLTAIPSGGGAVDGWSWDCLGAAGNAATDVTADTARLCKVKFGRALSGETFNLSIQVEGNGSVQSDPAGIICGDDCDESYVAGSIVQLQATPADGWRLSGFSGDADCEDGLVALDSDVSCVATFVPADEGDVTLFLTVIGPVGGGAAMGQIVDLADPENNVCTISGGTVSCDWRYAEGTLVQLQGTNSVEGNSVEWLEGCGNGVGVLPNDTCRVTMSGNREVRVRVN